MPAVPRRRGVLNVNKPSGPSSFDVIRLLRRRLEPQPERIGHAGTLDPPASGVLLILLEEATKVSRHLLNLPKEYEARILLGRATDTDDTTGRTISELPVPELTAAGLRATLGRFLGTISQTPPKFSALKRAGRPLYRLARAGRAFEPEARPVTACELELIDWNPPELTIRAVVSAGFYIRSLARDLGPALGTCATLAGLIRTRVGHFMQETAVRPEDVGPDNLDRLLLAIPDALPHIPRVTVSPDQAAALLQGRPVASPDSLSDADPVFAGTADGRFLALAALAESCLRPRRIIHAD